VFNQQTFQKLSNLCIFFAAICISLWNRIFDCNFLIQWFPRVCEIYLSFWRFCWYHSWILCKHMRCERQKSRCWLVEKSVDMPKSFYHHFEGRGKPAPSHEPQPDSCQQSNMQAANNAGPEKEAKILARRTTNLCAIPFSNSWPRLAYVGNNQATVHSVRLIPASWSRKPFSHLFG